ncbi:uncharacterized protein LOC100855158 isoform X4 [Vitis vinifera]|uniref:uncharacterized protein LOC100855158 isoform X4 n=1 Tax=Vitis vinifera TaxID=29760 RepID=UPI0008FF91CF|nr:uncharacterized protein LOC100855158 isoform X4 [Vitis vinifera]|eukprot:XP_019076900.1 PREDICTED: N-acetylglucosaminyl-phosphatidylinositol de-N-acetylase isoform X4 [Vitis vinifera]
MAWLLIIISVVLVWVASLCKTRQASFSPSKTVFLNNGEVLQKRNVLLVIAHPDDESIFICYVGNADGMGNIRKEELYQASAILKVPLQQVKILDHPDFQDGFGKVWNHALLAKIIEEEVISHAIDTIITFDDYGVSGHCNHIDVHRGLCRMLLHDTSERNIEAWELVSTNILRKYSGPIDIWLSILSSMCYPSENMHCLLNKNPHKSFLAMAQHQSQWVWFRKLFVSFSSYTYVNRLRKIKAHNPVL